MERITNEYTPDYSAARVAPDELKDWKPIAIIRAGGMFSAPTLMVGAALGLGLSIPGAAAAVLLGYGFVVAYMCLVSAQASDMGLPTVYLAEPSLGRTGARYLVALIVGIVTIGWFGVQTAVCGSSLQIMLADTFALDVPAWVCSLGLGLLMLATALLGFTGLAWLSSVAAPLLIAVCLYGVGASLASSGDLSLLTGYVPLPADAVGFIAGVQMAVGLFAFGGATSGDFARYARTRADAVISTIAGVIPAVFVALMTAACLAILTGEGDVAALMNTVGFPGLGVIALVLSTWTVNAGNVYSAGLGFAVMLHGAGGQPESTSSKGTLLPTAISGVVGIALAVGGILDAFQSFLSVLSATGPALAGTFIADYWLVRRGRPANVRVQPGVSAPGILSLSAGLLVGCMTGGAFAGAPLVGILDIPFFIGPVNGLVTAMLVYLAAFRLSGRQRRFS